MSSSPTLEVCLPAPGRGVKAFPCQPASCFCEGDVRVAGRAGPEPLGPDNELLIETGLGAARQAWGLTEVGTVG